LISKSHIKDKSSVVSKKRQLSEGLDVSDITREIIFELNEKKEIIYVNQGWKNILGYEPEETIDRSITEFLNKGEHFNLVNEAEANEVCEKIFVHRNGTERYLDIMSKTILNEYGVVVGIYGSMVDRTELKMVQNKEIQLRDLVENSKDIIYHYQVYPERKFLYLSSSISDVLGYSRERNYLDANLVFDVVHPDDRDLLEKKTRGEVDFNKPMQFRWKHSCGEYVHMEEYLVPIYDETNRLIGVQAVCRDITEQYLAEQQNEKLLETVIEYDRLKTEFFANMSHEFRTPLNIILGTIQLIERIVNENQSDSSNNFNKYLKMMKQNCYRLLRLINNLIEISRVDTGFIEMDYKNYNIVEVIEGITLSVAEYVENRGITLIFDTEMEEKLMACDMDKMERVMLNLLSNAIKFTNDNGHIFVTVGEQDDEITISVRDTGIGMEEDMLTKIFDRFRQVSPLLTRDHEGSGIGLSLVKSIIESHGGTISVKSEYGNGSEFIIKMPVRLLEEQESTEDRDFKTRCSNVEKMKVELSDIYG